MGKVYSVQFSGVTASAVQDLLAVYCTSAIPVRLHGIVIGQVTGTAVAYLAISIKRMPATVTTGSGGASVTPAPMQKGTPAATVTARRNDTTQATTSSTAVTLHSDIMNIVNGYQFFWPPDDRPEAGLSEAIVLSANSTPSSWVMSGTLVFEEML